MIGLIPIAVLIVAILPFVLAGISLIRDPERSERRTARRLARRHGAFE